MSAEHPAATASREDAKYLRSFYDEPRWWPIADRIEALADAHDLLAQSLLVRTGNEDAFAVPAAEPIYADPYTRMQWLRDRIPSEQFLIDVRAVVAYHWSGLPERRPDESVWARLDAVLFDDEGQERELPDYEARP